MPLTATADRRYGWRARVGFITPSGAHENNSYEFYLIAPEGVTIVMTSLHARLGTSGLGNVDEAMDKLEGATEEIVGRKPDSLIQAGVPYIVAKGWGFEDEVLGRIGAITSTPAATDIGGCIAAMQAVGIRKPVMLTPFNDELHRQLTDYVAHGGIEVQSARSVLEDISGGELRGYEVSTMNLGDVKRFAAELFRATPGADGVWITGALMPTVAAIEPLEQELGVPVVSSMQAMAWRGLRLAGVEDSIQGFGTLLREH